MSEPSFQMPHLPSGAGLLAVLTFLGTIVASLLTWFGVRFSQRAPLQEAVNHSVETLMKGWEAENRRSAALITELRHEIEIMNDRLGDAQRDLRESRQQLSGDLANVKQVQESGRRLQEKQGRSPIPPTSKLREGEDDD